MVAPNEVEKIFIPYKRLTPVVDELTPVVLGENERDKLHTYFSSFPRGIISLDIDGHLVNREGYQATDTEIFETIANVRNAGYLVFLNSDRPANSVREYQQIFRTDDPNVCERGGIVDFTHLGWKILLDQESGSYFSEMRRYLKRSLSSALEAQDYKEVSILWNTGYDPLDKVSSTKGPLNNEKPFVLSMADQRYLGVGLWVLRKTLDEGYAADENFSKAVELVLNEYENNHPYKLTLEHVWNKQKTFLFLRAPKSSKAFFWKSLLAFLHDDLQGKNFYHLGDGDNDLIKDKRLSLLTIDNATPKLKDLSIRVSGSPFTSGVVDNLRWILKQDAC